MNSALTDAEILAVACTDCDATTGQRCRYTWPKGIDPDFTHYLSAKQKARVDRVGQPTKRPHNARYTAAYARRDRLARRRARPPFTPASADRIAASHAEREFERREHEQLRAWLARHAGLLLGADPNRRDPLADSPEKPGPGTVEQ